MDEYVVNYRESKRRDTSRVRRFLKVFRIVRHVPILRPIKPRPKTHAALVLKQKKARGRVGKWADATA